MDILRIRRFQARYHLPPSRRSERERLDKLLNLVLSDTLERALERIRISPYEEICIRNLHVPVRLSLTASDSSLAMAWSLTLAEAIIRARNGSYVPGVVRYSSRVHALVDLALGVASGNLARIWAWRLAGIWTGPEAPDRTTAADQLFGALQKESTAIVPVLKALAGLARTTLSFTRFAGMLSNNQWFGLARAALTAAGFSPGLLAGMDVPGIAELESLAHHILVASPLARAISELPQTFFESVEMRRSFAALLLLAYDPGTMKSPTRSRALVSALADAMHPVAFPPQTPKVHPVPNLEPHIWEHRQPDFRSPSLKARPYSDISPPERQRPQVDTSSLEGQQYPKTSDWQPESCEGEEAPVVISRRVVTHFGGLLFLLGLMEDLGLPDEIPVQFYRRPFHWVLHQLALNLVPAEADDPAVLAFAGLMPDVRPPSLDDEPPTEAEAAIIASFVRRLEMELEERLQRKHPIPFVCYRHAVIEADPGWIEVRFALDEVSTEIRRAGLDLDPGYVSWLGLVLKFVYE
jgi:hypothetical protein